MTSPSTSSAGRPGCSTPPATATSTASSFPPRGGATPGRVTTSSSRSRCWSPSTWARSPSADLNHSRRRATMRKLIESTLVSLDGVTEAPEQWVLFDDEAAAYSLEQLGNYDAFVMGRVTYEQLFANWGHTAGNPYIDRINAMP